MIQVAKMFSADLPLQNKRKSRFTDGLALAFLLLIGGLAIAGPAGLLAWSENLRLLDQREQHLAVLLEERDALKNKVDLLDPNHADPDLVEELLRSELNVLHANEVVVKLND